MLGRRTVRSDEVPMNGRNVHGESIRLKLCPCDESFPMVFESRTGFYCQCIECGDTTLEYRTVREAKMAWNAGITPDYIEEQLWERADNDEMEFRQLMADYRRKDGTKIVDTASRRGANPVSKRNSTARW